MVKKKLEVKNDAIKNFLQKKLVQKVFSQKIVLRTEIDSIIQLKLKFQVWPLCGNI